MKYHVAMKNGSELLDGGGFIHGGLAFYPEGAKEATVSYFRFTKRYL